MERQANYALIGIVSVVLLIGGLIFIVWLANFKFNQTYDDYRIILRGPVSGLSRGGDVQLNGIKFGEITNIQLDPLDPNRVLTDIQLEHGTPVRVDSVAQTMTQGITGVKIIQISPGSPDRPLLRKVSREHPPVIMAGRSRLEDFVQNSSQLMRGATEAVGRINKVLSDDNIGAISQTMVDVQSVTGALSARKAMFTHIDQTFAKLDRAAADLQTVTASARQTLGGPEGGALKDVAAAAAELHGTLTDVRRLFARTDSPAADLSNRTMPGIDAATASIQQAADSLNRLTAEIQRDPRGILVKPVAKEVELPR